MPRTSTTPATKQACDACRRRKVRCDGQQPCAHCQTAELVCTYLMVRRKGGRRGKSANVLSELRARQGTTASQNSTITTTTATTATTTTSTGTVSIDDGSTASLSGLSRGQSASTTTPGTSTTSATVSAVCEGQPAFVPAQQQNQAQQPEHSTITSNSARSDGAASAAAASFRGTAGAEGSSGFVRTPGLLPPDLVERCIDFFFTQLGGTVPILHRLTFEKQIERAGTCLHAYCLLIAFCAFVVVQTGGGVSVSRPPPPAAAAAAVPLASASSATASSSASSASPSGDVAAGAEDQQQLSDLEYGRVLLREAMEVRKHLDLFAMPARQSILVAFFLYGSNIGLGNQRHAYYFLREATTLYTSGILDAEPEEDAEHPSVAGKLFWLLVVSERAHAIRRHRPVTLQITPESPPLVDDASSSSTNSCPSNTAFRCLVNLYRPFDESFLGLWNGTHTACSADVLVGIEEHIRNAVPADLDIPDVQMADLRVSQQWLRTMIWQLSTTLGFLSSTSTHKCMTFRYPLQIARDLAFATWKLPLESMAAHGVGLIEKLFEVACTLTDVISCLPATETKSSGFELGPEDYLKHFFWLISTLRGGRRRFLPLLLTKVAQTLPGMVNPIVMHLRLGPVTMSPGSMDSPGGMGGHAVYNTSSNNSPADQTNNAQGSMQVTSMGVRCNPAAGPQAAMGAAGGEWTPNDFNYVEISRIGDKTPEIAKAFLRYSVD
ncbi:hypothetical protein VTO42DRAFT_154 [Malbranchea cinnamomea]